MPIRPQFATYKNPYLPQSPPPTINAFESQDFLGGLIKDASPEIIPLNSFQNLKNVQYIRNLPIRRNGLAVYSLAKPDSSRIAAYFGYFDVGNGIELLRFSTDSIYRAGVAGWTIFTGPVLNSGRNKIFSFTVANNRAFFSNDGEDVIMEIDSATTSYAALGDAPQYRYLGSAFGRLIGGYLKDPIGGDIPYQIGWSGDNNLDEWNPLTDISAGFQPIINSPSDLSDDITGIFTLSSVLCVTRQRSIWLATNLPSATNPFNFYVSSPKIGCDCPQTIVSTANSLIFYSFQSANVFVFTPGSQPEAISDPVKRAIKSDIPSINSLFASYNFNTDTYTLFITNDNSSLVKAYSYNFTSKVWTYDEYTNVTSCNDVDFASSTIALDELGTTTLDNLMGTLDELGGIPIVSSRFFGFSNGDTCTEPIFSAETSDVNDIVLTDNGAAFESFWDSKTLTFPNYDSYFNFISIEYTPFSTGTLTLQYSRDDGVSFKTLKTITVDNTMLNSSQIILARKPIKARRIFWRLSTSDCMISLNNFRVESEPAGVSTR